MKHILPASRDVKNALKFAPSKLMHFGTTCCKEQCQYSEDHEEAPEACFNSCCILLRLSIVYPILNEQLEEGKLRHNVPVKLRSHQSTQRTFAMANGALRVWFVRLAKGLPDLPNQLVTHEHVAPVAEELSHRPYICISTCKPFRTDKWKGLRKEPLKQFLAHMPQGLLLNTYG